MREDIISNRGYMKGIHGDELSLKISSYPITAQYLAKRLACHGEAICELCCGIGVTLIELSKNFNRVIGVDNDQSIIGDCRKNLENAEVVSFELLTADITLRKTLKNISADIVLYDIPYWSNHSGQVNPDERNPELLQLIGNIRELISPSIVIYAPIDMTYEKFCDELGECEYAEVYIDGKYDRNFIFLGPLVKTVGKVRVDLSSK